MADDQDLRLSRRRLLGTLGIFTGIAGCTGDNETQETTKPLTDTSTERTTVPPGTTGRTPPETPTETGSKKSPGTTETTRTKENTTKPSTETTEPPTETETPTTTEEPRFPSEGALNPTLNGEEPWPQEFFNGNVEINIPYNTEQLRDRYHYQQAERIADSNWIQGWENEKIIQEFGKNLLNEEWGQQNIIEELEEIHDEEWDVNYLDLYVLDPYDGEESLKKRLTESSGYISLWEDIEIITKDRISSNHAFIRTAALSSAEKHTAGKNTFTTNFQTEDNASHGLGTAITNPTYYEAETGEQETYGIDTDDARSPQIWEDMSQYPNKSSPDQKIFTETDREYWAKNAWRNIAFERPIQEDRMDPWNVNLQFHDVDQFIDFVINPEEQRGMKYVDSACLAAYINEEAYWDGELPEFEDATLEVYPDRIEYSGVSASS